MPKKSFRAALINYYASSASAAADYLSFDFWRPHFRRAHLSLRAIIFIHAIDIGLMAHKEFDFACFFTPALYHRGGRRHGRRSLRFTPLPP